MDNSPSNFEPGVVDTPDGMTTSVGLNGLNGVPAKGTGLSGAVFQAADGLRRISDVDDLIANNQADATFTASQIYYGSHKSSSTVADFLNRDAGSIDGSGDAEFGPTGMLLSGYIYIPAGVHEISVISDDGFRLELGGVTFSEFASNRATAETARTAEFDGGLYEIDLTYYDQGGGKSLRVLIDGLPVDQSAYYQTEADFTNPPAGVGSVPVTDYHPGTFAGEISVDGAAEGSTTSGRDLIEGKGGDDDLSGGAGDDEIIGNYGDDKLNGGDGNDVIDGGYGSDLLIGGKGDDLLISRSDAGEQRIGQLAIGKPTRQDPDNEVDNDLQKLKAYADQPLTGDDIMVGGEGRDTFLILPQLNAKLDIIQKHVRVDGTINWAGVAGENNELHDHWVDSFGIDVIADYNAEEDHIAVIGHTANVTDVTYRDVDGDGDEESIVTILSLQHGGGGAHTMDLIGQIIVHGDRVEADDIETDNGVTYGVVENYADVAEALYQPGDEKTSMVNGQEVKGYDTRDANGNLGGVTGAPEDHVDNPYADQVTYADPSQPDPVELTREGFEPLEMTEAEGRTYRGANGNDMMAQNDGPAPAGLPGALGFWSFAQDQDGRFADGRGGNDAIAYSRYENQARLNTDADSDAAPTGRNGSITFDGKNDFAFIHHDPAFEISQGTIAVWVRPEDPTDKSMFISKDQSGNGDGGHFRLGQHKDGGIVLRMAEGDGGSNHTWTSTPGDLKAGEWTHLAVSFTEDGVTVYADGKPIPASSWTVHEGDVASPNVYTEAFLTQNEEPWVIGADQRTTKNNDSAQEFATDARNLDSPFKGEIADFGIWGGSEKGDALTQAEINGLIKDGPGAALTNPSGPQDMQAADDTFFGGRGNDTIDGGAGDDVIHGQWGNDKLYGGYGDDELRGAGGNDILDGGRGSDLLLGGKGDDTLISRSDAGEQRIGQLVIGEPSRDFPDPSVDNKYLKLVDWIDQPLVADDVLVGGEGRDHFKFETLINGKKDILIDNLKDDGRTINWHKVAGENARLHDHWVDAFGIDIIADYNAKDDKISVIGHTTQVKVDYHSIDTDGNGFADDMVSVITAYSQQGNNGGAHDEDYLGYIVVYGDLVAEEDIIVDAGAHYGIVESIDDLQEAVAPSGDLREGEHYGYDTRDVDGDPIGSRPEDFTSNKWFKEGKVNLASANDKGLKAPDIVEYETNGSFDGTAATKIAHSSDMALRAGTFAFSFTADEIVKGEPQALLSKDHSGYKDGGHLNIYIDWGSKLVVRYQSKDEDRYLKSDEKIEAGEQVNVSFSFSPQGTVLYINGKAHDMGEGFPRGMLDNSEDMLVGASSHRRWKDDDKAEWFFKGDISDLVVLDRAVTTVEALVLAENDNDTAAMVDLFPDTTFEPQVINGTSKADTLRGGDGNDRISGNNGDDDLAGLGGNDKVYGGNGNDDVRGNDGDDMVYGGRGTDTVRGGAGNDLTRGGDGNDTVFGDAGNDRIYGEKGDDKLFGGDGDDWLAGAFGMDELEGGAGSDIFQFGRMGDAHADKVLDFVSGEDTIALRSAGFGQTGDVDLTFGKRAEGTEAQFIYTAEWGRLVFDADGTGAGKSTLVATFERGLELTVDDFAFV
ncbi:LamG-like jellyroll fold domain-containing protein [Actibacterium sp. 188UL27-1]|uniref:LamG-like jellyroll fold domain-containing protein n=1 Tax=Actibacterium sp. 188UL27-1 TaxID=2786961 RepID=UPI001EF44394|nr:LamG-like jellyroll fold domain-containing protein [Actibacterium sp. 188UL27-1]